MINAGVIVATSLVDGDSSEEKIAGILEKLAVYTGHRLSIDQGVYESEKTTGHRNRAIAHLLRNYGILEGDPEQPLDAYFQQCSILGNARDLALVGATLANDGVNPITGVRALQSHKVSRLLSAMSQLLELTISLMSDNKSVLFANTKKHYQFTRFLQRRLEQADLPGVMEYDDLELALEQAGEYLLSDSPCSSYRTEGVADLTEQPLCRNVVAEELALLESLLEKENYKAGQRICHEGEEAERLFFPYQRAGQRLDTTGPQAPPPTQCFSGRLGIQ